MIPRRRAAALSQRKPWRAARPTMTITMPWDAATYPVAMRHLSEAARDKAIAIANALLEQGEDEGKAIRIAIARARRWAREHGLPERDDEVA
jgi:uncharacterized protein YdaT